jgi:hypothetical protein
MFDLADSTPNLTPKTSFFYFLKNGIIPCLDVWRNWVSWSFCDTQLQIFHKVLKLFPLATISSTVSSEWLKNDAFMGSFLSTGCVEFRSLEDSRHQQFWRPALSCANVRNNTCCFSGWSPAVMNSKTAVHWSWQNCKSKFLTDACLTFIIPSCHEDDTTENLSRQECFSINRHCSVLFYPVRHTIKNEEPQTPHDVFLVTPYFPSAHQGASVVPVTSCYIRCAT